MKKPDIEDVKEEEVEKIEGKEQTLNDEAPLVNGSLSGRGKPLENGVDDDRHDLSIGDITVDSVKDHLM